jgi:hypothetical protein
VSRRIPSTRTSTTTHANTTITGLAAVVREAAVDPPVSTRREAITTPPTRVAPGVTTTAPRDRSLTCGTSTQRRTNIDDPLRPVIVSTRPNVGYPQYRFHPEFIRPGSFILLTDIPRLINPHSSRDSRPVHTTPRRPFSSKPNFLLRHHQRTLCWNILQLVSKLIFLVPPSHESHIVHRNECSPWVLKVAGSSYSKTKSWDEAKDMYNGRLYADACEVLR